MSQSINKDNKSELMVQERRQLPTRSDKYTWTLSATSTAWNHNKACTQNNGAKANQPPTTTTPTPQTKNPTSSTNSQTRPNQHTTTPNTLPPPPQLTNPPETLSSTTNPSPIATPQFPKIENSIVTFTKIRRSFTTVLSVNCWFVLNVLFMGSIRIIIYIRLRRLPSSWKRLFIP